MRPIHVVWISPPNSNDAVADMRHTPLAEIAISRTSCAAVNCFYKSAHMRIRGIGTFTGGG